MPLSSLQAEKVYAVPWGIASEHSTPCPTECSVPALALLCCPSHPARCDRGGLQARTARHWLFVTCVPPTGTVNTCCALLYSLVDWEGRESLGQEGRSVCSVADFLEPTAVVEGTPS